MNARPSEFASAIRPCRLLVVGWMLAAWALTFSGCSDAGYTQISGVVTLDGAKVANGMISMLPADGKGPTAGAIITGGRYALSTAPGPKKVEIHAYKKTGTRRYHENDPTSPMVDVNEELIPARYHTPTELTAEVVRGSSELDFKLESR